MDSARDLKTIYSLIGSLVVLDKEAPLQVLLGELDVAYPHLKANSDVGVGDPCHSILHGYLLGKYSARECDMEGRALYDFSEKLRAPDNGANKAFPHGVFCYLRSLARLCLIAGMGDISTEERLSQSMTTANFVVGCSHLPASKAQAILIDHLSDRLSKLTGVIPGTSSPDAPRSRVSSLAE